MDVVITYVDGLDPLWQKDYEEAVGKKVQAKRFRDWGTLKYLLRGIEFNMPFIRNVYLVVSRDSQVPSWVNRENLHIVLHEDIIPERFLPVFNSTAIEMFLHRIPGLDEQFIYFNDDMFPVMHCSETDFYTPDGKLAMGFSRHLFARNMYKMQVRGSDRLARKYAGRKHCAFFIRPQHICSPMLKSDCEELSRLAEADIEASITRLRDPGNFNQYVFLVYSLMRGHAVNRRISKKHISMAVYSPARISEFLCNPTSSMVCINDVDIKPDMVQAYRDAIVAGFETILGSKSRFELDSI